MEVYAEFKPCYKTTYTFGSGAEGTLLHSMPNISKAHFIDGKARNSTLFITADLKYVYFQYNFELSFYKVTNVSSKPIQRKVDKVKEWHRINNDINKLKELRKKLMQ